jgi:spectinomycin phosphotransferase
MLVGPNLDPAEVAAALKRAYGLAGSTLRFIPRGETAWCYQVTDGQGGEWFVKLVRPGAIAPARVQFALELGWALADLGLPVPRPLPTLAGTLWSWLDESQMTVVAFVDGEPLTDEELAAAEAAGQAARLVAAVHGCTPALAVPIPFAEALEVGSAAEGLWSCLAKLEQGVGDAHGLLAEARDLVRPQRAALLDRLARLQAQAGAVRCRPSGRVLCHGDLIGDNLLRDRDGRLWLVDSDGATLAPRERDLALFAGPGFGRFLDGHQRDAGDCDLDPDLIAFFLLRRNLDDLVDWLLGVLASDQPETQRAPTWMGAVVPAALGRARGAHPVRPRAVGMTATTRPQTLTLAGARRLVARCGTVGTRPVVPPRRVRQQPVVAGPRAGQGRRRRAARQRVSVRRAPRRPRPSPESYDEHAGGACQLDAPREQHSTTRGGDERRQDGQGDPPGPLLPGLRRSGRRGQPPGVGRGVRDRLGSGGSWRPPR